MASLHSPWMQNCKPRASQKKMDGAMVANIDSDSDTVDRCINRKVDDRSTHRHDSDQ